MTLRVSNDSREWAPFVYHNVVMEIVSTLTALIDLLDQWKKTWFLFLIQTLVENSAESLIRTALNENAYQYRKKKLNGYDNPSYVTTKIVKETDRAI